MTAPNLEWTTVNSIPEIIFPEFQPCPPGSQPPTLPSSWSCVALLHPFSPPLPNPPNPDTPFTEGRYLWTWYSPFPGSDGTHSRPVTFMESASEIGKGTSLALADYFYYEEFKEPIDPRYFEAPAVCTMPPPRTDALANTWMRVKEVPTTYLPRGI